MIRLLIVDDERLEREGVKYLLAQENKEWRIYGRIKNYICMGKEMVK